MLPHGQQHGARPLSLSDEKERIAALVNQLIACEVEADALGLDLVAYLVAMARLEVEGVAE